jgi:putative flippase GtrA
MRTHEALLFGIVSLIGWLLDFAVFNALIYAFGFEAFAANYVSSVIGSTFAFSAFCLYSASHGYAPRLTQIASYVIYQLVSITFYSILVQTFANSVAMGEFVAMLSLPRATSALIAKVAATPLNFVTNYISTRTLLRFLRPRGMTPPGHAVR